MFTKKRQWNYYSYSSFAESLPTTNILEKCEPVVDIGDELLALLKEVPVSSEENKYFGYNREIEEQLDDASESKRAHEIYEWLQNETSCDFTTDSDETEVTRYLSIYSSL